MALKYLIVKTNTNSQIEEIGVILHRMVGLLANSEQVRDVAKARAVIVQAQKDLANRSEGEKAKRLLAKLEGMLNQPVIGGTMKIAFTALDGTQVDLAAMKGKVVLVDYWATWCAPCVASLPEIKTAYDRYHDKGFEVIGISLDHVKDKAKVETFLEDKKLPWPQSFDGKGWSTPLAASYGISAIPEWSPNGTTWLTSGQTAAGIPARNITVALSGYLPSALQYTARLDATGAPRALLRLRFSIIP